jgi:hypothetical protein
MWFVQLFLCLKSFNSAFIINYVQKSLQELKGAQPFNTKSKTLLLCIVKVASTFQNVKHWKIQAMYSYSKNTYLSLNAFKF